MAIPLLIAAGAAGIGSAIAGAVGSANASAAQQKTAGDAMAGQERMYGQQREDMMGMWNQQRRDIAPWQQAGQSSLGELMRQMQAGAFDQPFGYEQLANDPGFQFRMQQGQRALERSASARGLLNSGSALKSLERYSQGLASDEYQNAWARNQTDNTGRYNRLAAMAGVGQQAAQNLGAWGGQTAANMGQMGSQHAGAMGNLYGAMGNAQAAGAMGGANAVSGGFGALGNMATLGAMYQGMGGMGGGIPTQTPAYGQSTLGYQTQGYGPWR